MTENVLTKYGHSAFAVTRSTGGRSRAQWKAPQQPR